MSDDLSGDMLAPSWPNLVYYNSLVFLCIFSALKIAFGSLYKDDVMISPARVTQVLAAATLLGLVSCATCLATDH